MIEVEAYVLLQEVFNSVFGRIDIIVTPTLNARDVVGWNSLKQLDIIMEIEDRLGIEISGAKLEDLRNVGDLAGLVIAETLTRSAASD